MNSLKKSSLFAFLLVSFAGTAGNCMGQTGRAVVITPQTEEMIATAGRQGKAITDAIMAKDYGAIVDETPPDVVTRMGGREKAIAGIKEAMEQGNLPIKSAGVEPASQLVDTGKAVYVVIPEVVEIETPKGTGTSESFLLGISNDRGTSWKFIDGAAGASMIREVLPDLPATITLPERKKLEISNATSHPVTDDVIKAQRKTKAWIVKFKGNRERSDRATGRSLHSGDVEIGRLWRAKT